MMNGKFSVALLWLLVVALLAGNGWQWLMHQQFMTAYADEKVELKARIEALETRAQAAEDKLVALEKSSVKGIIRQTNDTILSGWESLMNSVEQEIKKARENLESQSSEPPANTVPPTPEPQPKPTPPTSSLDTLPLDKSTPL